jgi:hypothetical protein
MTGKVSSFKNSCSLKATLFYLNHLRNISSFKLGVRSTNFICSYISSMVKTFYRILEINNDLISYSLKNSSVLF